MELFEPPRYTKPWWQAKRGVLLRRVGLPRTHQWAVWAPHPGTEPTPTTPYKKSRRGTIAGFGKSHIDAFCAVVAFCNWAIFLHTYESVPAATMYGHGNRRSTP